MGLITAWMLRLWEEWDVRALVLLSFTLQIILYLLGSRRKYLSSLWISIFVWSAYLMADWVATVALGKLSNSQVDRKSNSVNPNNALKATWAPLLLLHLGGPDTITAYSLEDNQLWMRHLLGLVVQAFVAVYVIFMSWRNSWFSFLSLPALMAGLIKYGEKTWVLKSVSNDKSDIIPFGYGSSECLGDGTTKDGYVRALVMAHKLIKEFKHYMVHYNLKRFHFEVNGLNKISQRDDTSSFWDALQLEMGLMYDFFYTKASKTYTKWGSIRRSISFACTMFVLIGFFWIVFKGGNWHEHYSMVDVFITGVLLVGALVLEIYAVTILLFSNWTMLWLIRHNKSEWVIQLGKKFPWLFPMLKNKEWSKMMGQFDLFGFCIKEEKCLLKLLGWLGIPDKFNWQLHSTSVPVPPDLYSMILDYMHHLCTNQHGADSVIAALGFYRQAVYEQIFIGHLATEMCYHDVLVQANTSQNSSTKDRCRILSHYIMYLILECSSVLPLSVSDDQLKFIIDDLRLTVKNAGDVGKACQMLLDKTPTYLSEKQKQGDTKSNDQRVNFVLACKIVLKLKEKQEEERWRILKAMWLRTLFYLAINGSKINHLQQLRQGGELLTLLWFAIPQSDIVDGIDIVKIHDKLK
ncbi:uncharacterized protein LOC130794345 isoform X1 [Actinidia eriantha]|uniref:uncharacterized protein LOC130794345 isoform X1 n=1 Tax=Actinidia eriantha TaxID=165200 RepID=UPI0025849B24|nr:uncharacterized protein LOC130794345 isoform X1 [Actinidia eriantha]XP_057512216.1 uncharacterized protein LOC130794345 isoform X1 [Actinidia eriantha]